MAGFTMRTGMSRWAMRTPVVTRYQRAENLWDAPCPTGCDSPDRESACTLGRSRIPDRRPPMVAFGCRVKWPGPFLRRLLQEPGSPSFVSKTGRRLKRRRLPCTVLDPSSLRRGPRQAAGVLDRDAPEFVTSGDKESFEFRSSEGAIGDHVSGDRDGLQ